MPVFNKGCGIADIHEQSFISEGLCCTIIIMIINWRNFLNITLGISVFTFSFINMAPFVVAEVSNESTMHESPAREINADIQLPNVNTVAGLLKEEYKVIQPNSGNPFPVLVPCENKNGEIDPVDKQYQVLDVKAFADGGFFKHEKIIAVVVFPIVLEARIMSGNRSRGLFAFGGNNLLYLNGSDSVANVSLLLERENKSLEEADAKILADLFSQTVLREDNNRIVVIETAQDIMDLHSPDAITRNAKVKAARVHFPTVNRVALERCKPYIVKPEITGNAQTGWHCHFIGLCGWMHTIRAPYALIDFDINISPTFKINIVKHVLSDEIMN